MLDAFRELITHPVTITIWAVQMLASLAWTARDLATANRPMMPLMKAVWLLTVLYSGVVGLLLYRWSGRAQIPNDDEYRRAGRSVAHCYSGCGAGEVVGVVIAVGLLALPNLWVAAVTFTFAYVFGIALTVGPMMQEGMGFGAAMKDAVISETASITVMEVVAIGTDLFLAGEATMGEPLFWASLAVSLTLGLAAAYPVNLALIRRDVKEGMMDPREMQPA